MIRKIALCAGLVCTSLLVVGVDPSGAVDVQSAPPGHDAGVPPHEVLTIVRSMGLEPLTRPVRNGPAYALRAIDPAGEEVRVVVDARRGRVLHVSPLGPRFSVMPAPYGRPPGRIPTVPDGYGPSSRIAAMPPGADGPAVYGPGAVPPPRAPATAAPHPSSAQAGPPPLPRPRPKVATAEKPTVAQPEAAAPVGQRALPPRDAAKEASKETIKDTNENDTTGTTAAAPAAAATLPTAGAPPAVPVPPPAAPAIPPAAAAAPPIELHE